MIPGARRPIPSSCFRGAVQVQGTINGYGERCGNANLCTIIPALQLKRGYAAISPDQLKSLTTVSIFVSEITIWRTMPSSPMSAIGILA